HRSNAIQTRRMSNQHVALLGGGNMGRALIGGMLRRGTRPEHISVGESFQPARDALAGGLGPQHTTQNRPAREALAADFGIQAPTDNAAAVEPASVIVVAVKPQIAGTVLTPLQPLLMR